MKGLARVPELTEQARNVRMQIAEAQARVRASEAEIRRETKWIEVLESRARAVDAEIRKAYEEQAAANRQAILSPGSRR